jgi:serine/threonine protein kinase
MDPQPTPPAGLIAGKYEVLRLIGRGGMGSVWEGRHVTLGTRVAIKFIDSEYAESKEARSRFDTEARAAAALQSKHAIQIYDHGVTDDQRPYMVMELLTGEPLDERIDRVGRISLPETARILAQVCRALQRAHEAGIIHRDLKPENIFLVRSPDDDDEVAKVLDFGIAKIKTLPGGGELGLSSSTKTGAVLGTPYYMAPEQARGLRSIDYRADLWSLGVIAYKCVSGVLPFEGESVGDLLVKICTAPPPVPSRTMPEMPLAFDVWFARTMERDPARRFVSAAELADALAIAAGVSLRRGAMPSHQDAAAFLPPRTPHPAGAGAPTPLPAAGLTSAPLVTSAGLPRSSRSTLLVVVAAALVGGSIGVVTVVKLLPHSGPSSGSGPIASDLASAGPSVGSSVSGGVAMGADAQAPAARPMPAENDKGETPKESATTAPSESASALASARGAAGVATPFLPAAGAVVHRGPPPLGRSTPTPTPGVGPAPVKVPPPTKSSPPSSDPGY